MNRSGQMFGSLIVFFLVIAIFLFAVPTLFSIISSTAPSQGTATRFVVKVFPWVIIFVFIAVFFKIVKAGEGLFVR